MELEWDVVWGWEWRISLVDSKCYNGSDCAYDILMGWFLCGIFDVGVETFWCCLKTLLLLPSNGCNTWLHFHPQSWSPSAPLSLTLPLNSFPILILFLYLTVTQSWVLTNPSLGPHASPESSFFPCLRASLPFTLSVHWKPIPNHSTCPSPLPGHLPSPSESTWPG